MKKHSITSVAALVMVVLTVSLISLAGQESDYTPQTTPWGDPDLRGHYLPGPLHPMETPRGEPWGPTDYSGHNATFGRFFRPDPDSPRRPSTRPTRPLVIDPPDGRIPLQDWAAQKRDEIMANPRGHWEGNTLSTRATRATLGA